MLWVSTEELSRLLEMQAVCLARHPFIRVMLNQRETAFLSHSPGGCVDGIDRNQQRVKSHYVAAISYQGEERLRDQSAVPVRAAIQ